MSPRERSKARRRDLDRMYDRPRRITASTLDQRLGAALPRRRADFEDGPHVGPRCDRRYRGVELIVPDLRSNEAAPQRRPDVTAELPELRRSMQLGHRSAG